MLDAISVLEKITEDRGEWVMLFILANFLLRVRRNCQNSTSGQIFKPKI